MQLQRLVWWILLALIGSSLAAGRASADPICELEPPAIDFGHVPLGETTEDTLVIRNVGDGILLGNLAEICPDFDVVEPLTIFALFAGDSATFTIRYTANTAGPVECTLATNSSQCASVLLTGYGELPPSCVVDPLALDFGTITVGQNRDLTVTLTNQGEGILTGAISLPEDCDAFSLLDADLAYELGAGEKKEFAIRFAPTGSGPEQCVLQTGSELCSDVTLDGVGELPPACGLDPAELDFETVTVGSSRIRSFTITNVGEGVLDGTISLTAGCDGFTLVDSDLSYSLTAAASKSFAVRFQPEESGSYACTIETGAEECHDVGAVGQGELPPSCAVEPSALEFGTVLAGQTKDLVFEITNTGEGLLIGAISLGAGCDGFRLVGTTPGYSLGAGETKAFPIRFAPPDSGSYACTLQTGSALCPDLPLSGIGDSPPFCVVDPPSLDFGDVFLGEDVDREFTIRNDGGSVLSGSVVASCDDFTLLGAPQYSLTAGQSRSFTLRFAPDEDGDQSCDVDLGSAPCGTYEVTGSGVLPPRCEVEPRDLDFGIVRVGESEDRLFSITNDGGGRIQGVFTPSCSEFIVVGATGYDVGPFESRSFTVRYRPTGEGADDCEIDLGGQCGEVAVQGTGQLDPICQVEATTLEFGSVLVGAEATREFMIRNDGGGVVEGTVALNCAEFDLVGEPSYSLTAGESRSFAIRFRPVVEGIFSCAISTGNELCTGVSATGLGVGVAECSVLPTSLDFGEVKVGKSRTLSFSIENNGENLLEGAVSPSCGEFTVLEPLTYALSAGQSQSFEVRFDPTDAGQSECSLDLGHADCSAVDLTGTGLALEPGCEVDATELEFDAVTLGESADLPFNITNTGETTLQGQVVPGCTDFSVVGSADYEIAPSESATFTIRFTPVVAGSSSCTIDLGNESCASVSAHGIGVDPGGCTLLPTALDFGDVPIGSLSELPLYVENRGETSIQGLLALEGDCTGFALIGSSAYNLGPGEIATFTFRFEPSSVGEVRCRVTSACGESELQGRGVLPPLCVVTPTFLDFGNVAVGSFVEREIVVANEGAGRLQGSLTSECAAFRILGDPEFDLGSGEAVHFVVRFTPTETGPADCTLSSGTDACPDPILFGFAVPPPDPQCEIEPASLQFGSVQVGSSAELSLVVRNVGSGRLVGTLTSECVVVRVVGDPSFDLAEGENQSFTLRYSPVEPGELTCSLQAADCKSVEVLGNGLAEPDPSCGIFPSAIDFGPVIVGEIGVRSLSISNSGGGTITGALRIDPAMGFQVRGSSNVEVGAGETKVFEIEFAPQLGGGAEAMLSVEGSDLCGAIPLRGRGASVPGAACRVDPVAVEFGAVALGESKAVSFVVHNDGTGVLAGELDFDCASISTPDEPRFAIDPGEKRTFEVVFLPTVEGNTSCTIALGTPGCILIARGRGVLGGEPECGFDPATVYFGSVEVGAGLVVGATTSAPAGANAPGHASVSSGAIVERVVRITNHGGGRLEGIPITDCAAFTLLDAPYLSLAAGESHDLRVAFHPSDAELYTCGLALGEECVANLAGSGVTKSLSLSVPARLDLIGLSLRPTSTEAQDVFGALGALGRDFDLWSWSDGDSAYVDAEPTTSVEPGTGYWIRASRARTLEIAGEPEPSNPFVMPLAADGDGAGTWTLLANPFQYAVSLDQILVARGEELDARVPLASAENELTEPVLWGWNGESYFSIDTLAAGEGFWVHQLTTGRVSVILEPNPYAPDDGSPLPLPEWTIALTARQGLLQSSTIEVGAAPVSSGEWNSLDFMCPPDPPAATIAFAIPHPEWGARAGGYCRDYQPERGTMIWDLSVNGLDPENPLELELASDDLPAGVSLHFTYWDGRQRTLARAPGSVTFQPMTDHAMLRLVARFAPPGEIPPESELPGLVRDVPVAVPNPFGVATEVHFVSETAGPIVATIFDAHGRKIRELRTMGVPGEVVLAWDGFDDRRSAVETGVYLVRIDDGAREQTLRLLRIR